MQGIGLSKDSKGQKEVKGRRGKERREMKMTGGKRLMSEGRKWEGYERIKWNK